MGTIYLGLVSRDGYVFITNDAFGSLENESAVVRVNKYCGALIVTAKGDFLVRMRKLLTETLADIEDVGEGLSMGLAEAIKSSFEIRFQTELEFKQNPLPFLMLLIGYHPHMPSRLEHIFVRNRVVEILEKDEQKEYRTMFDLHSPVRAENLFYGHSDLSQYLFRQLQSQSLSLDEVKLLAYFAVTETQKIDTSILPDIRIAALSPRKGFEWLENAEQDRLSDMAKVMNRKFSKRISDFFALSENDVDKQILIRSGK